MRDKCTRFAGEGDKISSDKIFLSADLICPSRPFPFFSSLHQQMKMNVPLDHHDYVSHNSIEAMSEIVRSGPGSNM